MTRMLVAMAAVIILMFRAPAVCAVDYHVVRFAGGAGHAWVQSNSESSISEAGTGAMLDVGVESAHSSGWRFGGEFCRWSSADLRLGVIALTATSFPWRRGTYIRFGVGGGLSKWDLQSQPMGWNTGVAFLFSAGYEWHPAKGIALAPQVSAAVLDIQGVIDTAQFVSFTLGFHWLLSAAE